MRHKYECFRGETQSALVYSVASNDFKNAPMHFGETVGTLKKASALCGVHIDEIIRTNLL